MSYSLILFKGEQKLVILAKFLGWNLQVRHPQTRLFVHNAMGILFSQYHMFRK